jgi:hypothetical protein
MNHLDGRFGFGSDVPHRRAGTDRLSRTRPSLVQAMRNRLWPAAPKKLLPIHCPLLMTLRDV